MPYIHEVWQGGNTIEVRKYHSWRYPGKGGRRGKNLKGTTSTQNKVNIRKCEDNLRRLMNENFCDDDYLITGDYRRHLRPKNSREMQEDMKEFLKDLRKAYKEVGAVLKYIYVKEIGPRGAAHWHMMLSSPGDYDIGRILKRCWTKGGIHIDPLNTDGQYGAIARYFIKYADKTIETEGELVGKRYYPSRNLKRTPPVKRIIRRVNSFYENIRIKDGWYLEPDSEIRGITEDGYECFGYTLHKIMSVKQRC